MRARPLRLAVLPAALVAAGASAAAPGGPPAPRLSLGAAAPLFAGGASDALRPGDRVRSCATVRNTGDRAGRAALYARDVEGSLAGFLSLTVTRGCDGQRGGLLYAGRLADFPRALGAAVVDPVPLAPGEARGLRFELALGDDPAAAGRDVRWSWRLAVGAATQSRSECLGAGARRDRLVRTRRLSARVRAVLVVRAYGRPGAVRLVLTTGLRVRGRTLLVPRWARVGYRVNGGRGRVARRRPFRVRVPAGVIRPGTNRVAVTVRPRRGPARTTTFRLRAARAGCLVP